jgi:hypothetical protein
MLEGKTCSSDACGETIKLEQVIPEKEFSKIKMLQKTIFTTD